MIPFGGGAGARTAMQSATVCAAERSTLEIASASRTLVRHIRHSYRAKADREQIALFDAGRNDLEGRVVEPNDAFLGIQDMTVRACFRDVCAGPS